MYRLYLLNRNVCNKVLVSRECLEENQNNSQVNEDSLYRMSSEGEDSITACKEVSQEDLQKAKELNFFTV